MSTIISKERRIYTINFKQRLNRLLTVVTTLISATAISISTLAAGGSWSGEVISFTKLANYGTYPFGYSGSGNLSWRVDLYVSHRSDGTLDPSIDTIKSAVNQSVNDEARYVGSLLYTQEDFSNTTVYIQAEISTFNRNRILSQTRINNNGASIYDLPYVEELEVDDKTYGSSNPVYVVQEAAPNDLPMNIGSIGTNYSLVKNIVSTPEFTSAIIDKLSSQMGTAGTSLLGKLGTCLHEDIKSKVKTDADLVANLLPTSDNPLVEWAAVVSPMLQFDANSSSPTAMWFINDSDYMNKSMDIFNDDAQEIPTIATPAGKSHVTMILDAYGAAQYNYVTKKSSGMGIYNMPGLHKAMTKANVNIPDAKMIAYQNSGVLTNEFGQFYTNVATASIINEAVNPYFSVPCSTTSTSWDDKTMARQGGIGIYVTKKNEAPSIPVYYYITPDPNDPITPPSTATPPNFTPEPPPGTVVTKVVIPTDNDLVDPDNPPDDFPDPVITPYKEITPTGDTYPIDPDNPPDHILVECKETDDIPIYYHVFTFNNTTGKTYTDVFEYLADNPKVTEPASEQIYAGSKVLAKPAKGTSADYIPATDSDALAYGSPVAALSTSIVMVIFAKVWYI